MHYGKFIESIYLKNEGRYNNNNEHNYKNDHHNHSCNDNY